MMAARHEPVSEVAWPSRIRVDDGEGKAVRSGYCVPAPDSLGLRSTESASRSGPELVAAKHFCYRAALQTAARPRKRTFSVQQSVQPDGFERPSPFPPPRPWLVADIGGTNARFGWVDTGSDDVLHVAKLQGADFAGPTAAAQAYLAQLQQTLGAAYRPPAAGAFAVATAVAGDHIAFTNSGWAFSRADVERELGL